jgi:hypothetical protein
LLYRIIRKSSSFSRSCRIVADSWEITTQGQAMQKKTGKHPNPIPARGVTDPSILPGLRTRTNPALLPAKSRRSHSPSSNREPGTQVLTLVQAGPSDRQTRATQTPRSVHGHVTICRGQPCSWVGADCMTRFSKHALGQKVPIMDLQRQITETCAHVDAGKFAGDMACAHAGVLIFVGSKKSKRAYAA